MATSDLTPTENTLKLAKPRPYERAFLSTHAFESPFNQAYLDRLAQEDAETSTHFIRYFTKVLLVQLRHRFRSSCQAEDIAQETLYRVLQQVKNGGSIQHPERLPGFVRKVSENVAKEYFRQGCRFQQVPEHTPEPVARALNAEVNCITAERKEMILRGLRQLKSRDRIVLEKIFLLEQDKDAICLELKIDRNYLRVQAHRALSRFRKVLGVSLDLPCIPLAKKAIAG